VNIPTRFTLPDGHVFSDAPRMVVVKGFASAAACDWLIELARPHLRVADIYDRDSGELTRADGLRTNSAAPIDLAHTDLVLAFLRARIAAITEVPLIALEASQVLHYEVGQQFAAHHDFLDVTFPGLAREVERGGQRGLTLLIYLNEGYGGGETAFPRLGRSFKGRKGDALIFWNVTEDGKPDWSTEHIGTAPTKGEKWLFSQWIRVKPA